MIGPSSRWLAAYDHTPADPFEASLGKLLRQGTKGIIDLRPGDPVRFGFANQEMSEYLVEAVRGGFHAYASATIYSNLKKAIASFEKREGGVDYSADSIVLTPGLAAAYHSLHYALLDPGDEMATFDPGYYFWCPARHLPYFKGNAVSCRRVEEDDWEPDIEDLRAKITKKTRAIVLSNPDNPTGSVLDEKVLKRILDVAGEHNLPVVSDEIYRLVTFDGVVSKPLAALSKDVPVIMLSGLSKAFMRTGWRLGYICFHDPAEKMTQLSSTMRKFDEDYGYATGSIPTPILVASTKVFEDNSRPWVKLSRDLQSRRDFVWKRLNEIEGVSCTKPRGAMYALPRIEIDRRLWKTDSEFFVDLLEEQLVAFVPGYYFGKYTTGHFRTLLMPDLQVQEEAISRLERFLKRKAANQKARVGEIATKHPGTSRKLDYSVPSR